MRVLCEWLFYSEADDHLLLPRRGGRRRTDSLRHSLLDRILSADDETLFASFITLNHH